MSGWDAQNTAPAGNWNEGAAAAGWNEGAAADPTHFNDGFNDTANVAADAGLGAQTGEDVNNATDDKNCRNCGQEGHFARECPEPRKGGGACFNCGEDGHNKADCPAPRKPNGPCRSCNQEGHFSATCPNRKCKNCQQEGHDAHECKNPKFIDNEHVASKSEAEAWVLLEQASEERDIADFKEAVQILTKSNPAYTYPELEKEFRQRGFKIFLIAMEKDHGDTWTNVNIQGEVGKKYAVSYFTSANPQRPALLAKWPKDAEENLSRLADAGVPLDRGIDKCNNCGEIGHRTRGCPQERVVVERPKIICQLCNEEGHRVRDCTQERKRGGRACKICESEEHIAKDCPQREKPVCRNCGEEGHIGKDCTMERKMICRNCDKEGHMSKECTEPRKPIDWSKVVCSICQQTGHGRKRCPQAPAEGEENAGGNAGSHKTMDNGGGWEASAQTSNTAPAAWEQNEAFAPSTVPVGGGW